MRLSFTNSPIMGVPESVIVLLVRVLLFSVYLLIGAAIFQALEQTHQKVNYELKQKLRQSIQDKYNITASDLKTWAETYKANMQFQGGEADLEWNFGNAFLFAAVTVTTIGYGNIVPQTFGGRLFCIIYAFFGIPGTCLTLKAIGDSLYNIVARFLTAIERRIMKRRHPKNIELKTVVLNLSMTLVVILPLSALIVYAREHQHWTYFECFYFTFTTLTTIGYGDYVPYFGTSLDFLLLAVALLGLAFVSSILCSLNNLYEAYGLSKRVVRSIKKTEDDADHDKGAGCDVILDEEEMKQEDDNITELPEKHDIKPRPSLYQKRGSVSVGMIQA